jgi:hypothetical protein
MNMPKNRPAQYFVEAMCARRYRDAGFFALGALAIFACDVVLAVGPALIFVSALALADCCEQWGK